MWRAWKENQIYEPETIQSLIIPIDFTSQNQQKKLTHQIVRLLFFLFRYRVLLQKHAALSPVIHPFYILRRISVCMQYLYSQGILGNECYNGSTLFEVATAVRKMYSRRYIAKI